jgi:anti-sigma28 factor (negative regulator of flagellin synthesis)
VPSSIYLPPGTFLLFMPSRISSGGVNDPETVVRHGVVDISQTITPLPKELLSAVTRKFSVFHIADAEKAATKKLAAENVGKRYGLSTKISLRLMMDERTAIDAAAKRDNTHRAEVEELRQKLQMRQEQHNRELLTERVETYRAIIAAGNIDQFALHLAQHPKDAAAVLRMISDQRDENRRSATDFVTRRHCCIKAKGVLATHQSGEAGPLGTLKNRNKPGIRDLLVASGRAGGPGQVSRSLNATVPV